MNTLDELKQELLQLDHNSVYVIDTIAVYDLCYQEPDPQKAIADFTVWRGKYNIWVQGNHDFSKAIFYTGD